MPKSCLWLTQKFPLEISQLFLSWVGRVWAWQRFVHWGRRQIVTQRKGLQGCLWAPTKPKRSYEISGSAFERSWQPFVLAVSFPVLFCPSNFYGWCSGQLLVLARDQNTIFVPFLGEGLWSLHPDIIDVGAWRATARDTSHDTALHGLQGSGSSESSSTWGISGDQQHPAIGHQSLGESVKACCWWAADGREGNKSVLFWITGYVLSLCET